VEILQYLFMVFYLVLCGWIIYASMWGKA